MKNKKLAICANGWSIDALFQTVSGIRKIAVKEDFDVYTFLSYASYSEYPMLSQGELNIYKLCRMEDYDGIVVFSGMLNSNETALDLCMRAKELGIPVVSIGMEIEGIPSICIRNEDGMRELVEHLVTVHGVKRCMFMGGTEDHPDSIARLEITREVLRKHGLSIAPEDVCYGYWANNAPARIVQELIKKGKPFPDAIICANDVMALAAITEFIENGYSVPRDVIVTGFDHIFAGQYAYPALTTVKQNYETVGLRVCEMLFDQMRGKAVKEREMVPSIFVRGESCGCEGELNNIEIRRRYCEQAYRKHMDASMLEQTERVLRNSISGILSYQELKHSLQERYQRNHRYEGENFAIVVHSEYFEDPMASEEDLWNRGVKDPMEVLVALQNGVNVLEATADRKNLIPGYKKTPGEQHAFYLAPLHFEQYNYGYVVLTDEPYVMATDMLYPYLEKLQQSMKFLRINVRLDTLNKDLIRIYDRDPMTGLYNRFVYENKAMPLYEECQKEKVSMMVMFVDINYMKRINDEFGHIHGDNAIKTVAQSIKENVREDWIAVRYGGDEFLIVGPGCDEGVAERVREAILDYLERKNHDGSQPYQISASCGYVVSDPEKQETLQDYVQEADRLMYEIKKKVHEQDGGER